MDEKKVRKSAERIQEEAEKIEEEVKPKKAKTYGDPIVELQE